MKTNEIFKGNQLADYLLHAVVLIGSMIPYYKNKKEVSLAEDETEAFVDPMYPMMSSMNLDSMKFLTWDVEELDSGDLNHAVIYEHVIGLEVLNTAYSIAYRSSSSLNSPMNDVTLSGPQEPLVQLSELFEEYPHFTVESTETTEMISFFVSHNRTFCDIVDTTGKAVNRQPSIRIENNLTVLNQCNLLDILGGVVVHGMEKVEKSVHECTDLLTIIDVKLRNPDLLTTMGLPMKSCFYDVSREFLEVEIELYGVEILLRSYHCVDLLSKEISDVTFEIFFDERVMQSRFVESPYFVSFIDEKDGMGLSLKSTVVQFAAKKYVTIPSLFDSMISTTKTQRIFTSEPVLFNALQSVLRVINTSYNTNLFDEYMQDIDSSSSGTDFDSDMFALVSGYTLEHLYKLSVTYTPKLSGGEPSEISTRWQIFIQFENEGKKYDLEMRTNTDVMEGKDGVIECSILTDDNYFSQKQMSEWRDSPYLDYLPEEGDEVDARMDRFMFFLKLENGIRGDHVELLVKENSLVGKPLELRVNPFLLEE